MKKPSIADNFFFAKVMQDNPDLCLYLIKLIIQDDLQDLDDVQMEKYIKSLFEAHAIQMDVLTVTDDTIIDLEMQKRYQKFLFVYF